MAEVLAQSIPQFEGNNPPSERAPLANPSNKDPQNEVSSLAVGVEQQENVALETESQDREVLQGTIQAVDQIEMDRFAEFVTVQTSPQRTSHNQWKIDNSKYETARKAFHELSPGLPYIDVDQKERFVDETRKKLDRLQQLMPGYQGPKRWNEIQMESMFGKGLNPTSLITTKQTSEWFVDVLKDKVEANSNLDVAEVGIGAGWSTVMLFNELKDKIGGNVHIYACDMSLHAIAATQTLLEANGIDYIFVRDARELGNVQDKLKDYEFSGVVLVPGEFVGSDENNNSVDWFEDDSLQGVYSSHGTAYFSEQEYLDFFNKISEKAIGGAPFVADSLHPLYTNRLSMPVTLLQMAFPGVMKNYLDKRGIKHVISKKTEDTTSKYFTGGEVKLIKVFNTSRSRLVLLWSNYLLRNLQVGKFLKTKKSLSITMDVVDAYRNDVYPSDLLPSLVQKNMPNKFSQIEDPFGEDFPIFMRTVGLEVKK